MSELLKAAYQALVALDGVLDTYGEPLDLMTVSGGTYEALECRNAITALRAALAQPEPLTQELERLRAALRYEENRFSRIGTHGPDCWKWGPHQHYECALRKIKDLEASIENWSQHD